MAAPRPHIAIGGLAERSNPLQERSRARKNPRSRRVSPGVFRSRLRDSNPRPTHYEYASDHVAWCLLVLSAAVLPDQSACGRLAYATAYYLVQRRPATGRPPRAMRDTNTSRWTPCRGPTKQIGEPRAALPYRSCLRWQQQGPLPVGLLSRASVPSADAPLPSPSSAGAHHRSRRQLQHDPRHGPHLSSTKF